MNSECLSCHSGSQSPLNKNYHPECARKLFGTEVPPDISFSTSQISFEAQKMVGKISVSGVQVKISLLHDREKNELRIVEKGGMYILKPQTELFPFLPENENLCMNLAAFVGIEVPPRGLLPLTDKRRAYIVQRFDRTEDGKKLQQEDFQQLLEKKDKYDGSYEQIANFIRKYSDTPERDLLKLFERALLFFVLGNGDAHLKNFSLIRTEEKGYHLSPAYDIVNSRLVLPGEKEECCLSIQGKRNKVRRNDFMTLADHLTLKSEEYENVFDRLYSLQGEFEKMIGLGCLPADMQEGFMEIFRERMKRIGVPN